MRIKQSIAILLVASLTIFSCSKDEAPVDPDENQPGTLITKMTQGVNPADDTVFAFNYDADRRIKSIVDVEELDTFEAVYSTAGLITEVAGKGANSWGSTSFSYNAGNQLVEANFVASSGGYKTRYTFEYTNGVVSKKSYYTSGLGNPDFTLVNYTTYEVTNGNITSAKQYGSGNTLLYEITYAYNNEPNVFQPICLFNWMNFLGADEIAGIEMFFNKNLVTSETFAYPGDQPESNTYSYTYNDKKQLTKVVVNSASGGATTRQFEY
ncbi:hypothetical protein [uncultured Chitinophaga sp.]|jgi:hypothetical protein|uniref:hypothetical protein n=1 Tax=uncultured Chitinophaga sp. TaxID=339340 RepID=UPI002612B685|nr:hypothetical protein [uncultured Chitinophaga sp.]